MMHVMASIARSSAVLLRALLGALLLVQSAGAADLSERLAACASCHGVEGEGRAGNEYYPHLAGKPRGYLLSQLRAFREGRRVYPQMTWLMRNLSDAYLADIAEHYAALPPRSSSEPVAMTADAAARARELVEQGDPPRDIPACTACHGANLAGIEPDVPALVGLPVDYVIAQLGAWKTGTRTATEPDCMATIAQALDPADMRRLGEWLASRGVEHVEAPAAAGSFALPRACGTMRVEATP